MLWVILQLAQLNKSPPVGVLLVVQVEMHLQPSDLFPSFLTLEVSINGATHKSSILDGFSLINHPFIGIPPWPWKPPH